ncbi:hypothetical protein PGQ11_002961 [Apiospora arundinis]|uniref:Uncharacterized protein n=1 Tax=Apiospora arundinis TaxID=335852 RepID=A0ABR2J471_9PEZI
MTKLNRRTGASANAPIYWKPSPSAPNAMLIQRPVQFSKWIRRWNFSLHPAWRRAVLNPAASDLARGTTATVWHVDALKISRVTHKSKT